MKYNCMYVLKSDSVLFYFLSMKITSQLGIQRLSGKSVSSFHSILNNITAINTSVKPSWQYLSTLLFLYQKYPFSTFRKAITYSFDVEIRGNTLVPLYNQKINFEYS